MTAKKLTVNVVVLDDKQTPVVLTAGSEVPDWVTEPIGDHCFESQDAAADKPARKPSR